MSASSSSMSRSAFRDFVKSTVAMFSRSQGFYGRLFRDLEESDGWQEFADNARAAGVSDVLSLVMWIEC